MQRASRILTLQTGFLSLELGPVLDMERTKGYNMGIFLVVESERALGAWAGVGSPSLVEACVKYIRRDDSNNSITVRVEHCVRQLGDSGSGEGWMPDNSSTFV